MLPLIVLTAAYSFERNTGRKILLEKIEIRKNYGIKKVNIIYVTTVQVALWYFFRLFSISLDAIQYSLGLSVFFKKL